MQDLIDLNETNMEDKKYPDPIFANGLSVQMPNPKLPENFLIDLNIKPNDFFKWCQENMQFSDANGWIKVNIKKSKTKGTIYGELNQFKPTPKSVDSETGEVIPDEVKTSNNASMNKIAGRDMTPEEELAMSNMQF
jgi:hypothetical protein